ncbi:MAG TPA: CdaR family protein [Candidatus Polarisedimenticolia bacterium]|jgi:YbbR domain-containing protein|nr:CdaR family protein [Candidatus Polarisedimenticolia bacterium]
MRFNLGRNLYLKGFSLLLAIVCWYVVRSEQDLIRDFAVPLQYVNLPADLDLSGRVVDSVVVRLRAPEPVLRTITEDRLAARIDMANAPLGEQYVTMTPGMIRAPGGAQIDHISPDLIKVSIDRKVRRDVPVVAEFSGTLPSGYEKVRHVVDPPRVSIEGPANEVTKVIRALTGTILLDGETSDYEVAATPIPDAPSWSRVRVVSPRGPVRVRISIARTPGSPPGAAPGAGTPGGVSARPTTPRRFGIGRGGQP